MFVSMDVYSHCALCMDWKHRTEHCLRKDPYRGIFFGKEFAQTKQPRIVLVPLVRCLSIHINELQMLSLMCRGPAVPPVPSGSTNKPLQGRFPAPVWRTTV